MKKMKRIILSLLLIILCINIYPHKSYAEDDGYYIKNMDVNVEVNDKREFKITETIDVYFNEERHGIIRDIPTSTRLEDYEITDVKVEGVPYVTDEGSNLSIKIGDEDETIEGDKTYKISYTIKNYNDERPEGDYIYFNVLGDQWDTRIENFTATIIYPKNAKLEKINVTDGEYGSTDSTNVKFKTELNKIYINSTKTIRPYNGVTVNAMLNEGAFSSSPYKQFPYTIKNENTNIDITEEKQYLVQRDLTIEMNKNYKYDEHETAIIDSYELIQNDNYYIQEFNVEGDNVEYSEDYGYIYLDKNIDKYKIKISYTIEPRLSEDIKFSLVSPTLDGKVENLKVNINAPFTINDATVDFSEKGPNLGTDRFNLEKNKDNIVFTNKNTIYAGENVSINLDMDNSLFVRPLPMSINIVKFGAPIFLLMIMFIFFVLRDKKIITPAVEFYPPRNMNSAEVGYAFNESISNSEATTLLFYWASKGYIKIIMKEKNSFTIEKLKSIGDNHKSYEKKLFNSLFKYGKSVKDTKLKDYFGEEVTKAVKSVKEEFKGEKALRDRSSKRKGLLLSIVSCIPLIATAIVAQQVDYGDMIGYVMMSIILLIIHLVFYSVFYSLLKSREGRVKKKYLGIVITSIIYLIVVVFPFMFTDLNIDILGIVILVSLIGNILSACIPRRSDYGKQLLGEIIGFRNFIEVAEKERLEALIEEDPQYFYNTLPYAQVLGVTKKWTNKFKDISMQPPTYYDTYYPLVDYYAINRLVNDLNKVESSVSHSSIDTSSSGSGGGFGGGGFSGGGSGGGGGSSW